MSSQPHGPKTRRRPPTRLPPLPTSGQRLGSNNAKQPSNTGQRRASVSGLTAASKAQRTSKTTHKLVVLPSAPQTRPLVPSDEEDLTLTLGVGETDDGLMRREYKSEAERMTKVQRKEAGYRRLTAYCVAEAFKMKLLASFLKREHNVAPRVFDEALYAMYHLPLLPGYGPNANVRSSVPSPIPRGGIPAYVSALSEAEEDGYQGTYFAQPTQRSSVELRDGYISSNSPVLTRSAVQPSPIVSVLVPEDTIYDSITGGLHPSGTDTEVEPPTDTETPDDQWGSPSFPLLQPEQQEQSAPLTSPLPPLTSTPAIPTANEDDVAEIVFFEYGVVVFFGLTESQERDILEDIENAGVMKRRLMEEDWEVEECHYAHDPYISYPRIYNDFFTLKSRSHLLKLSISHALAQSTLLARYEAIAQRVLSSPSTLSIPRQLASSGSLRLRRHEALKLTGKLFMLRRDVNLVSNVLDVPELFWSEASLQELYDAVRSYMEIGARVQSLNEKLGVTSDFLDAIHDHLNNSAMERITWIVIWLIVVAILVELGEVIARLIVHATLGSSGNEQRLSGLTAAVQPYISASSSAVPGSMRGVVQGEVWDREEVLRALERMMNA